MVSVPAEQRDPSVALSYRSDPRLYPSTFSSFLFGR